VAGLLAGNRPPGRLHGACRTATGAYRPAQAGAACARERMEFRILGPLEVDGERGPTGCFARFAVLAGGATIEAAEAITWRRHRHA